MSEGRQDLSKSATDCLAFVAFVAPLREILFALREGHPKERFLFVAFVAALPEIFLLPS